MIEENHKCAFCYIPHQRILKANEHSFLIGDGFPISLGHSLIIPFRHIASFFDATTEERASLLDLLDYAKTILDIEFHPDGYNVGINDGTVAGQTVPHLHIHLIPRYIGDREDPRGGVRWIIPEKADYWSGR